jgi:hypothetical protein
MSEGGFMLTAGSAGSISVTGAQELDAVDLAGRSACGVDGGVLR